jgi:glycine betaine transporter
VGSAPILRACGQGRTARAVGRVSDLVAIVAIAIGVGGSMAMGVFQVQAGVESLLGLEPMGLPLALGIFFALVAACGPPLLVTLDRGMAVLSKTAMGIASGLLVFILLFGPTHYLMQGVLESLGEYVTDVLPHGLRTYTFLDEHVEGWFWSWTLTFMVWWVAWAPFVGLFIARISRGRTTRGFIVGVMLVPTAFSIVWFGVFGGIGCYGIRAGLPMLEVVQQDVDTTMFFLLDQFPVSTITTAAVVAAAFLFIVTSVVSASFVPGMFSTGGGLNPSRAVKLSWGAILGGLGLVMIHSGGIDAAKSIVALGALPFSYVMPLLVVCFLKTLRNEEPAPPADSGELAGPAPERPAASRP